MNGMVLLASVLSVVAAAQPAALYVAPDGNDRAEGTIEAPFATLHRARDAVRHLVYQGLDADVVVYVRGGMYYLDAPFALGPQDSGTAEHSILYTAFEGEQPVLSGGRRITGWERGADGRWTVTLPDVASGAWYFRQLFRGDQRLPRGRFPNDEGLLHVTAVNPEVTAITVDQAPPARDLAHGDAELVVYQNWSITRARIASNDGAVIHTGHPAGWIGHGDATTTSPGKPCYLENALEFVDAPGEWYLDRRTGVLTYYAADREDPNAVEMVAPRLERLLVVRGAPEAPVRNVYFAGLTFQHAEWPLPEFGYIGIQAGHHGTTMEAPTYVLPGAIEFAFAESCRLKRCRVAHTGACGIVFGAGCRENVVDHCSLEDIGGNGVMVGWRGDELPRRKELTGDFSLSADWLDSRFVPRNNAVADCTVRRCGAVNYGCVGIFDAFCDGTHITHNLVTDMPYTGISIGFRWDESETSQRNCIVEYNEVHDVMKMLADGGAIYTLGLQPGTVLRGNVLYDVHRSTFAHGGAPNNGIFFDQGSKGYLVEGNIIYNTSGEPIRFNQTGPDNLDLRENAFGGAPGNPAFPVEAAAKAGPRPG